MSNPQARSRVASNAVEAPAPRAKSSAPEVIITCAVTGSIHTPTMSPFLPLSPEEIAEHAIEAAEAGASILHLHVRDPIDGRPSPSPDLFREVVKRIEDCCDAVINIS